MPRSRRPDGPRYARLGEPAAGEGVELPETFRRRTAKFWARPQALPQLLRRVAEQLPLRSRGPVRSVYLDSPALDSYRRRTLREDGAQLLRLRWYGSDAPERVFVERKTHRRGPQQRSVKERVGLAPGPLAGLLGAAGAELGPVGEGVRPVVRTEYFRTAFESEGELRATVDEQLWLLPVAADAELDFAPSFAAPAALFPLAVFELKDPSARADAALPAWVRALVADGVLVPAGKFSKFAQAVATLHRARVPLLPPWEGAAAAAAAGAAGAGPLAGGDVIGLAPADPRSFLALERTLASWVRMTNVMAVLGVYLATAGLPAGGALLVAAHVAFVAAAMAVYRRRLAALRAGVATAAFLQPLLPLMALSAVAAMLAAAGEAGALPSAFCLNPTS